MVASKSDLQDAFGTMDLAVICKEILNKGDLQVTEKEREALYDG
jgi:ribosome maturation protein Sdo1